MAGGCQHHSWGGMSRSLLTGEAIHIKEPKRTRKGKLPGLLVQPEEFGGKRGILAATRNSGEVEAAVRLDKGGELRA